MLKAKKLTSIGKAAHSGTQNHTKAQNDNAAKNLSIPQTLESTASNSLWQQLIMSSSQPLPIQRKSASSKKEERKQIGPRLTIGPSDDHYEREADRVAENIMAMPGPMPPKDGQRFNFPFTPATSPLAETQKKPIGLQRKPAKANIRTGSYAPTQVHEVLASPGQALDSSTQTFMSSRFGRDFSQVRIHTGSKATESAHSLNAKAYTSGNNIVFDHESYQPNNFSGKQLIAHELSHVVQQNTNTPTTLSTPLRTKTSSLTATKMPLIQRTPHRLTFPVIETPGQTVQRLVAELNEHMDNGRTSEARALVPDIQTQFGHDPLLVYLSGRSAASALLRLGMNAEANQLLQGITDSGVNAHTRQSFSLRALELLYDAGNIQLQAGEHAQAWTAFSHAFDWLESRALSTDLLMHSDQPPSYIQIWYPRIIAALFSVSSQLRSEGNHPEAIHFRNQARDRVINSPNTHRYAEAMVQALLNEGQTSDAFNVLENANAESPGSSQRMLFSEQAIAILLDSGEQAVQEQNWSVANQVYAEALRWVNENSQAINSNIHNYRIGRSVVTILVDRIMRGLLAIIYHLQQAAIAAFQNNDPNAAQLLQSSRSQINSIRQLVPDRLRDTLVVAELNQNASQRTSATFNDALGESRELTVGLYGGQMSFEDRLSSIQTTLESLDVQGNSLEHFYVQDADIVTQFEAAHGRRPDIHSLGDRHLFWELKYNHLISSGSNRRDALQALIDSIHEYLQGFTFHTEYNVPDTYLHPLTNDFPRTVANQALMDCGIYAMRTAYELSLLRNRAHIDFHYVTIPQHVYLAVVDRGNAFGWGLSNNVFRELEGNIATTGIATVVANRFATIPVDPEATQINSTSESALRNTYRSSGRTINRPPNVSSLSPSSQRRARERSNELAERYRAINRRVTQQTVLLRNLLATLQTEHSALTGSLPAEWVASAADRILALSNQYEVLTQETQNYMNEVRAARGNQWGDISSSLHMYFFNMDLAMKYVVHQLGRPTMATQAHIRDPLYERIEREFNFQYNDVTRNYNGTPPPWDIAIWQRP